MTAHRVSHRGALILAGLLLLTEGAPALASEVEFKPVISLSEEYNDNIFSLTSGKRGDFLSTVSPALAVSDSIENASLNLAGGVNQLLYLRNSSDDGLGYFLRGSGSYSLTPRLDLRAGDEYHESFMAKSVLDFVTVDDQPIVLTSVEQLVVARGMHCHEGFLFFFRIYNTADKLNILISYGGAPFRLHFIFPREHISLNIDARYIVRKTFRLIDELSCLAYILLGQWLGEEKRIR